MRCKECFLNFKFSKKKNHPKTSHNISSEIKIFLFLEQMKIDSKEYRKVKGTF